MAQPQAKEQLAAGPRAVLLGAVHDFGVVELGRTVTHDFEILNDGDAPLELFDANSSCGCTVLDFDERIEPGKVGRLRVGLDPGSQEGAFAVGVSVFTNDQANAKLTLTLKAELPYRVVARPGYVRYVTHAGSEEGRVITLTLWAADGNEMRITSVESPYPFVEASFRKAGEEERLAGVDFEQWKVETKLLPVAPVGAMNGMLLIHVDHPVLQLLRVPLLGFVDPVFAATPEVLDFGEIEGGKTVGASLQLKSFAVEEIELQSVESTVPGIEVRIAADAGLPGRLYFLTITLRPDMRRGAFAGVIRVHTASSRMPIVEVPLKGNVR